MDADKDAAKSVRSEYTEEAGKIKQIEGCQVRLVSDHSIVGRFGMDSGKRQNGKIEYNGKWLRVSDFVKLRQQKVSGKDSCYSHLEVCQDGIWNAFLAVNQDPEFTKALRKLIAPAIKFVEEHSIESIDHLCRHDALKYVPSIDPITDKLRVLLRTCEPQFEYNDIDRVISVSSSHEGGPVIQFVKNIADHIKFGTKHGNKPFVSATLSTEVVRFWSCGFLKPVIAIDQDKVKDRAIYVGGAAGQVLFANEEARGPNMLLNFAAASDEVLIRDCVLATEYERMEPEYKKTGEWVSMKGSRDESFPDLPTLRRAFVLETLGNGKGGIVKFTSRDTGTKQYIVKVGGYADSLPDEHIQNEFLGLAMYAALGVPVPRCCLQAYTVKLTIGKSTQDVRVIEETTQYVLVREYITGNSPETAAKAFKHPETEARAVSQHILGDIILCNFDIIGKKPGTPNIIVHGGMAFRIDAGGSLMFNPKGDRKTRKNAVISFSEKNIKDQVELYFDGDPAAVSQLKSFLPGTKRLFETAIDGYIKNFNRNITTFRRLNTTTKQTLLPGWDDIIRAIQHRLSVFKETPEARDWLKVMDSAKSSGIEDVIGPIGDEKQILLRSLRGRSNGTDDGFVSVNVTNNGKAPFNELSPFCPYKDTDHRPAFEVPGMPAHRSFSVEGIWQGLKKFENEPVDESKFRVENRRGLKRPANKREGGRGKILGHFGRNADGSEKLLGYVDARKMIYLPAYEKLLNECAKETMESLYEMHLQHDLVLLDFYTNDDVEDTRTPLSHASLVKAKLHQMYAERNRQSCDASRLSSSMAVVKEAGGGAAASSMYSQHGVSSSNSSGAKLAANDIQVSTAQPLATFPTDRCHAGCFRRLPETPFKCESCDHLFCDPSCMFWHVQYGADENVCFGCLDGFETTYESEEDSIRRRENISRQQNFLTEGLAESVWSALLQLLGDSRKADHLTKDLLAHRSVEALIRLVSDKEELKQAFGHLAKSTTTPAIVSKKKRAVAFATPGSSDVPAEKLHEAESADQTMPTTATQDAAHGPPPVPKPAPAPAPAPSDYGPRPKPKPAPAPAPTPTPAPSDYGPPPTEVKTGNPEKGHGNSKAVVCCRVGDRVSLKRFVSATAAEQYFQHFDETNGVKAQKIRAACQEGKPAYGYRWKYPESGGEACGDAELTYGDILKQRELDGPDRKKQKK